MFLRHDVKSLKLGGRFVQVGKDNILSNARLSLAPFLKDLSFHSVQLDVLMGDTRGTQFIRKCLESIAELAEKNSISPIVDKIYAAKDIEQAFRYLASGEQLGKIIVDFDRAQWPDPQNVQRNIFHPDTLYVISGGLSALGWDIMKYMSNEGATRFLLLSYQGPAALSERQKEDLTALQACGIRILVLKIDVTTEIDVQAAYTEARKQGLLLSCVGILHMATVLEDRAIKNMDEGALHRVIDCKIQGARNLVKYFSSADNTIEFIVLISSISSVFGNINQANYAAGNSYLDQYAFELRSRGFKRVSVLNLSAVEDVVILAEDYEKRQCTTLPGINNILSNKQIFDQIKLMISEESAVQWIYGNFDFKELSRLSFMKPKVEHLTDYSTCYDSMKGSRETKVSLSH